MTDENAASKIQFSGTQRFLELMALNSWAIAVPLTDRLRNNAMFLKREELSLTAVCVTLLCFFFALPAFFFGLQCVVRSLERRGTGSDSVSLRLHEIQIASLIFLFLNLTLRWFFSAMSLRSLGVPDFLTPCAAAGCTYLVIRVRHASETIRQVLLFSSITGIISPLIFLTSSEVRGVYKPDPVHVEHLTFHAATPCPVVLIALDGCSGLSLMKSDLSLDTERFPGFGQLAADSTWYRNATTVHPRTAQAIPALLTGCIPSDGRPPLASLHPVNLLKIIYETGQFRMNVFEPFTQMSPAELRAVPEVDSGKQNTPAGQFDKILMLTDILCRVYIKICVPSELADSFGTIPRRWFGFGELDNPATQNAKLSAVRSYSWDYDRDLQWDAFLRRVVNPPTVKHGRFTAAIPLQTNSRVLEGISNAHTTTTENRQRPQDFHFLHVVLPHDPWIHLPSGRRYLSQEHAGDLSPEGWPTDPFPATLSYLRYLYQLQFVDCQLKRLMDEMKRNGLYEKSLLIVTADHGMSFLPGASRREPSGPNLSEILSIPLFIKLPGQQTGEVSDANVETIDVMPTVLDVLGIDGHNQFGASGQIDGVSVLADAESPKLRKSILGARGEIVMSAAFPEKKTAVARLCGIFGEGILNADSSGLQAVPHLIRRSIDQSSVTSDGSLLISDPSALRNRMWCGSLGSVTVTDQLIPCYLEGQILHPDEREPQTVMAVTVNDTVAATVRTGCDPQFPSRWTAMLPPDLFDSGENTIHLYEVVQLPSGENNFLSVELREIPPAVMQDE